MLEIFKSRQLNIKLLQMTWKCPCMFSHWRLMHSLSSYTHTHQSEQFNQMEPVSLWRVTFSLFTESLPALHSLLMAESMKHSSSGIPPSVLACRSHISPSGLWALFPRSLMPSFLLMHLTDASVSNLLIWAKSWCFVSIQMQPAGWSTTTGPSTGEMESRETVLADWLHR